MYPAAGPVTRISVMVNPLRLRRMVVGELGDKVGQLRGPDRGFGADGQYAVSEIGDCRMAGDGLTHHLVPMVAQLRKLHIRRPDAVAGDGGHHAAQFSRIAPRFAEVFDGLFTAASVVFQGRPATGEPLEYFGRQFGLVQVELAGDRRFMTLSVLRTRCPPRFFRHTHPNSHFPANWTNCPELAISRKLVRPVRPRRCDGPIHSRAHRLQRPR